jgi:peptidoglycan/xylan/chitin deacetylase (PgdA/CDA1 family)
VKRLVLGGALALALAVAWAALAALPPDYQSVQRVHDPQETRARLDITFASLGQVGRDLAFSVHTTGKWKPKDFGAKRKLRLCLDVWPNAAATGTSQKLCVRRKHGGPAIVRGSRTLDAQVRVRGGRSLTVRLDPAQVGLSPGKSFRWQFESDWPEHSDFAPDGAPAQRKLVAVHPAGCVAGDPSYVTSGPRDRPEVALTFDDGPGPYTAQVLAELENLHLPATFMLVGEHIAGHEGDLRRAIADGDILGDHTWDHANVAGDGPKAKHEIVSTRDAIEKDTHFTPCLFRAPYGATSGALIGEARRLGFDTLQWNVDPRDWSTPGTDAIVQRVVSTTHPGSIILMHDGGGPREQTVEALPRIVAALRARGYGFMTVPDLLGLRTVYTR